MSFARGRHRVRHMAGFGDSPGYNNPDGTPTYDGAPYDPSDPNNPYNQIDGSYIPYGLAPSSDPTSIPLSVTQFGTPTLPVIPTLVDYVAPTSGATGVTSTGLPAVTTTPANAWSNVLTSIGSIFTPKAATPTYLTPSGTVSPYPYTTTQQASMLPSLGGISSSTLLMLAGAGLLVALIARKKRAA